MFDSLRSKADQISQTGEIKPRSPIVALLISLFPGLGQHYAGFIIRGIVLYTLLIILSWLAAIAFMSINSSFSKLFLAVPFIGFGIIAFDAWLCAAKQPKHYRLKWFNQTWIYVGVTLFLMLSVNPLMDFLVGKHIVRAYYVENNSMSPTIIHDDILLINKLASPKRGDVAILNFSTAQNSAGSLTHVLDSQLIRRIIAVEGDRVEIKNQRLYINDQLTEEPYVATDLSFQPTTFGNTNQDMPLTEVPVGNIFILADNRSAGLDSRVLGTISKTLVRGKVTKVFWSWNLDEGHFKWDRTALGL